MNYLEQLGKSATGTIKTWSGIVTVEGTIYDVTADNKKVWIETADDMYVVPAESVKIKEEGEGESPAEKLGGSASIIFGKYEQEDVFGEVDARFLTVDMEVKAKTKEEASDILETLSERLAEVSDVDITWACCPESDEYRGKAYCSDMFTLQYEHGFMGEMKKGLMADFKAVKKSLGIR